MAQCTKSRERYNCELRSPHGASQLANAEQDNIDLRAFLSIIRKCTDLKELTPDLSNRLITKMGVFNSAKDENGKKHVPIKVNFIGVGVIVIPGGKTILENYEEIRRNPPSAAKKKKYGVALIGYTVSYIHPTVLSHLWLKRSEFFVHQSTVDALIFSSVSKKAAANYAKSAATWWT